jgi:hypothetical protein
MVEHGRMDAESDGVRGSVGNGREPKLKRKEYEKVLRELQTELCSVQDWQANRSATRCRL